MAIIKKTCKHCNKPAIEKSHSIAGQYKVIRLECGHTLLEKFIPSNKEKIVSIDGYELRPFQYENIELAEANNLRFLFGDEMGLGKTPSVLGALKRNPQAFPAIILVKAALKHQWAKECVRWLGKEYMTQIVHSSTTKVYPMFDVYIIGLDLLKNLDLEAILKDVQPKTIVIDECQLIKNGSSKRTNAVRSLIEGKISRKREIKSNLEQRKKIYTIAKDLMKYHGVSDRFELKFEDLKYKKALGLCECRSEKCEGGKAEIKGRIVLDINHCESDNEADIIDTILHEISHAITPGAGHSKIWFDTAQNIGNTDGKYSWCNGSIEFSDKVEEPKYVLAASGTPIKNHAAEFFPILNILDPQKFPGYNSFVYQYVGGERNERGQIKFGAIRPYMLQSFMEDIKHIFVRHERAEVMKELPLINRTFFNTVLGETTERLYKEHLKKLIKATEELEESAGGWANAKARNNVLAYITKMRQIVGFAKIDPCVEWVEEFLDASDDRKLCIFTHHIDVNSILSSKLASLCTERGFNAPVVFTSDLDSEQRENRKKQFINDPKNRLAILSTQSYGEGLDGLQRVCSDMILLERQWNPANEEQVEGRFSRFGATANQINAVYFLAEDTIDEYFADLVENKRKIVKSTLTGKELSYNEESLIRELVELTTTKGRKWLLKH